MSIQLRDFETLKRQYRAVNVAMLDILRQGQKSKSKEMSGAQQREYNRLALQEEQLKADARLAGGFLGWQAQDAKSAGWDFDPLAWREVKSAGVAVRYHVPAAVDAKGYEGAFLGYLAKGGIEWCGPIDRKLLSEGIDTAGGFAVPAGWQATVIKKIAGANALYRLATKVPVVRDVTNFPRVAYATDDLYTSPVRLTWAGETVSSSSVHRATDPTIGNVSVPVHTALASLVVSRDLLEDSSIEILATRLFGEAFAIGEADAYLNGNGAGRPLGMLTQVDLTDGGGNQLGPVSVPSGTSAAITTPADTHSAKRLLDLYKALPPQYRTDAAWLLNATTEEAVDNLVDGNKRPLMTDVLNDEPESAAEGFIRRKPVYVDQLMPDIAANSYPVALGDFGGYYVAERVGLSVQLLTETPAFEQNQQILLARRRVGGYLAEPWRVRVLKAG